MKKGDTKISCLLCKKYGHDEQRCSKLLLELKPKWFKDRKGKQTTTVIIEDLGSYSKEETKITIIGVKGKSIVGNDYNIVSSCASTSGDKKMNTLFHIRVIAKQNKINTLIDSGSQANIISKEVVKKLRLTKKTHTRNLIH